MQHTVKKTVIGLLWMWKTERSSKCIRCIQETFHLVCRLQRPANRARNHVKRTQRRWFRRNLMAVGPLATVLVLLVNQIRCSSSCYITEAPPSLLMYSGASLQWASPLRPHPPTTEKGLFSVLTREILLCRVFSEASKNHCLSAGKGWQMAVGAARKTKARTAERTTRSASRFISLPFVKFSSQG